jgi:hypothetical protein
MFARIVARPPQREQQGRQSWLVRAVEMPPAERHRQSLRAIEVGN